MCKNNYWKDSPKAYFEIPSYSILNSLFPAILEIIRDSNPRNLLDFGCGDGRFTEKVPENIHVSIYDISKKVIKLAESRLKNRIFDIYYETNDISKSTYELIVVSMVLICVENDRKYHQVISQVFDCLKHKGLAIFAIPHPCFRQYKFSDFYTSYSEKKPFGYFQNEEPFEVTVFDKKANKSVKIIDYHRTLSFTLNAIIKAGFIITGTIETPDDLSDSDANTLSPPFLIIKAKKP